MGTDVLERGDIFGEEVVVEVQVIGEVLIGSVSLSAGHIVSESDEGLH